jgi:uncharacterized protein (TIGR03083 family)
MAVPAGHSEPVVDRLTQVWASVVVACELLDEAQWDLPTDCPGWTVKDQLSHLIGIERMLLGDPAPPAPPVVAEHVTNDFGRVNEAWVEARRSVPGSEVLAEFVETTNRRIDALSAMTTETFDEVGWSPIGDVPYREFMATRLVDCWAHEQDMRRALDRPGGRNGAGEEEVLDRCEQTMPYVVGKRVAPPEGTVVLLAVTGVMGRHITVAVRDGRAAAVPVTDAPPTVSLTLDQDTFWRLCFGRVGADRVLAEGRVAIEGDVPMAHRLLGSMSFMT